MPLGGQKLHGSDVTAQTGLPTSNRHHRQSWNSLSLLDHRPCFGGTRQHPSSPRAYPKPLTISLLFLTQRPGEHIRLLLVFRSQHHTESHLLPATFCYHLMKASRSSASGFVRRLQNHSPPVQGVHPSLSMSLLLAMCNRTSADESVPEARHLAVPSNRHQSQSLPRDLQTATGESRRYYN